MSLSVEQFVETICADLGYYKLDPDQQRLMDAIRGMPIVFLVPNDTAYLQEYSQFIALLYEFQMRRMIGSLTIITTF